MDASLSECMDVIEEEKKDAEESDCFEENGGSEEKCISKGMSEFCAWVVPGLSSFLTTYAYDACTDGDGDLPKASMITAQCKLAIFDWWSRSCTHNIKTCGYVAHANTCT